MAEKNLDNKHPDWTATDASRVKSRDLYDGIRAVKAKSTTYLYQEPTESDTAYDLRLKRAVLDPWVEKVIRARQSVLFRKQPDRENLPAVLKAAEDDVDRRGTPASVFFEEVAQEAQIDGVHWVLIDMPRQDAPYRSRAEETGARHRPYFERIPASAVIDWEVDGDGALVWAVIAQSRVVNREAPGVAMETVTQWKVWYRDHWELYEATDSTAKTTTAIIDEGPNTSGVVPLVPFFGVKRTEQSGWPVCDTIADHVLLIYNKASDLDRSERIASHPTPCFISPEKPQPVNLAEGIWLDTTDAGEHTISASILEPQGTAFDAIRTSINALKETIYATALGQAKKDSAQIENADTQREGRKTFNASLKTTSTSLEESENHCWRTYQRWLRQTPDAKPYVVYNRDFDDSVIGEAMLSRLFELTGSRPVITREVFIDLLKTNEILPADINPQDIIAALDSEESDQAAALARTLIPVDRSLPDESEAA